MRGILRHFVTTLRLNWRNKQALIFGYVVPVFLLIAFLSIFDKGEGAVNKSMGRLLTISILGGACFGMPIAMVNERERGIWRRYRLTPLSPGWFLLSTLLARYILLASTVVLQLGLAMAFYKMPFPHHPLALLLAFSATAFAFIGIGLIISSIANSMGSVQALGQSLFLPMIMIGGVGVPIYVLPEWAQKFSLFLPGRYAVDLIGKSMEDHSGKAVYLLFNLIALLIIGLSAMVVGWKLFRWESSQRLERSAPIWISLAISTWIAIGLAVIYWQMAPAH